MTVQRSDGEPIDRLGRVAAAMLEAGETHPEAGDGLRSIVMLSDGTRFGTAYAGYGDDEGKEAFLDLVSHLAAIAEANGLRLELVTVPNDASALDV